MACRYAGVPQALADAGFHVGGGRQITRVAGASVGAQLAVLFAVGYASLSFLVPSIALGTSTCRPAAPAAVVPKDCLRQGQ
jgi:hypothetical protein